MTDGVLARTLLTDMIRIRRMEEKCAEMYSAGKIRGFLHLYVGEEAVAAGSLCRPPTRCRHPHRERRRRFRT